MKHNSFLPAVSFFLIAGCATADHGEHSPMAKGIREVISAHNAEVAECYKIALKSHPDLQGKLVIRWDIEVSGKAFGIKVLKSLEPSVDQCVSDRIGTWDFHRHSNNEIRRISFPFAFSTK